LARDRGGEPVERQHVLSEAERGGIAVDVTPAGIGAYEEEVDRANAENAGRTSLIEVAFNAAIGNVRDN
jgi:hypothetical protein